jgi:hypothetical protein
MKKKLAVMCAVLCVGAGLAACQKTSDVSVQPLVGSTGPVGGTVGTSGGNHSVTVTVRETGGWTPSFSRPNVLHIANGVIYRPAVPWAAATPVAQVVQSPITTEQVNNLAERINAGGLLDANADFGEPPITDQTSLSVFARVDGITYTQTVYALGVTEGVTPAQANLRRALQAWITDPFGVASDGSQVGDGTPTQFAGITTDAVLLSPADQQTLSVLPENTFVWPFLPAIEPGCHDYFGNDREAMIDLLNATPVDVFWVSNGQMFRLSARGLVPGETGC